MDALALLFCAISMLCWGVSPILYRFCGDEMSPAQMQATRSLGFIASAALLAYFVPGGHIWPGLGPCIVLVTFTIIDLGVGDSLYFRCVARIGAGKAAALTNTYPMYTVLYSWLLMGEGLSPLAMLGALTVMAGLMLLCLFKEADAGSGYGHQPLRAGLLIGLLSGMLWGTGPVLTRWMSVHTSISSTGMVFWRSVAVLLFAWTYYFKESHAAGRKARISLRGWKAKGMLASGVLIMTLPALLIAIVLRTVPASIVTPITGASPAVAALLGRALFKESITLPQWLGIALIIVGGIAVNLL